jgi:2',3'-cyclic-nucleotide 2'-phosphodiesterase (5'-nucleotidase family)
MNTRIIALIILAVIAGAAGLLLFSGSFEPESQSITLAIMTTSDLQSQVEPYPNETGSSVGGFARISGMQKQIRAEVDGALLISSGDDLTGTLFDLYAGRPEMESLSRAGFDVVCPGNHEFDFGWEKYRNATGFAEFPIVCANMDIQDPVLASAILPSVMLEVSGVKVGVFGLMTPDLARISSPGEGISVDPDLVGISDQMVNDLRSQGADLVIAVTHVGVEDDRKIAESVSGIDLIVGGHDHTYVNETVEGPGGWKTIIVQDGMRGERLGVLRFSYTTEGIQDPEWGWIWLDNSSPSDPEVEKIIVPYLAQYRTLLGEPVGVTTTPLDARKSTVRSGEAAAGNLIADAWRAWFPGSQIAFINGGGIRGDTIYPAGNLTYQILYEILPYRDEIVEITMTGRDIRQALECSASALGPEQTGIDSGGFLQVSGIHYTIDLNGTPYTATYNGSVLVAVEDPGYRVTEVTVQEADGSLAPLDDEEMYSVLVNAWLAGGGDGYWIFSEQENITYTTVYDIDPVAGYIRNESPVSPAVEDRIIIIQGS